MHSSWVLSVSSIVKHFHLFCCAAQCTGIHNRGPPTERSHQSACLVYSGVLERRVRQEVESQVQNEQYGFCPSGGTVDQLYTLSTVFKGAWCVDSCPSGSSAGVALGYGLPNLLIRAVQSFTTDVWVWSTLPVVTHFQWGLGFARGAYCHRFNSSPLWTEFLCGQGVQVVGVVASVSRLCFLYIIW